MNISVCHREFNTRIWALGNFFGQGSHPRPRFFRRCPYPIAFTCHFVHELQLNLKQSAHSLGSFSPVGSSGEREFLTEIFYCVIRRIWHAGAVTDYLVGTLRIYDDGNESKTPSKKMSLFYFGISHLFRSFISITCDGLAFRLGEVETLLAASC